MGKQRSDKAKENYTLCVNNPPDSSTFEAWLTQALKNIKTNEAKT